MTLFFPFISSSWTEKKKLRLVNGNFNLKKLNDKLRWTLLLTFILTLGGCLVMQDTAKALFIHLLDWTWYEVFAGGKAVRVHVLVTTLATPIGWFGMSIGSVRNLGKKVSTSGNVMPRAVGATCVEEHFYLLPPEL